MDINQVIPVAQSQQPQLTPIKRRSKGQLTREKILLSAIEVLAFNGLKGTTHRAIATHANLQLSLTTYYFKDIQELIHQAFKLNSERILSRSDKTLEAGFIAITKIEKKELKKVATKQKLCEQLSDIASKHLISNIKNHAVSLAVEQMMLTEVQISPKLRLLSQEHELSQLAPYEHMCGFFNKDNPELDAKIIYSVFAKLQYEQLTNQIDINYTLIQKTTRRLFGWIMAVK